MQPFIFHTDQFGISEEGVHFLRNGYNFETISYGRIDKLIISSGRQVNNWVLLLGFGILLSSIGMYTAIKLVYELFFANNFQQVYIEQIVFPLFPLLIGIFSLRVSLKKGPVFICVIDSKRKSFGLASSKYKAGIQILIDYLRNNERTKSKLEFEQFD